MTAESYSTLINEWLRARGLSLTRNDIPVPDDEYSDLGNLLADLDEITKSRAPTQIIRSKRTKVIPPAVLARVVAESKSA